MPSEPVAPANIAELRVEAGEARHLASVFRNRAAVADLLKYASALEVEANRCEEGLRRPEAVLIADNFRGSMWSNAFFARGRR